jgi:hypothetical protein
MNRLLRFVLLLVTLWMLVPVTAGPALADPIGGMIVIPSTGTNLEESRLRTSAGLPAQANAYYGAMRGHNFTPEVRSSRPIPKLGYPTATTSTWAS